MGSPHYNAHKSMESFWNNYRKGRSLNGIIPTIEEYNRALYSSLQEAGFSTTNSASLVVEAYVQQRSYGYSNSDFVPRVPGRINQKRQR